MSDAPVNFNSPDNAPSPSGDHGSDASATWKKWIVPVAASVALLIGLFALIEARSAKKEISQTEQGTTERISQEQVRLQSEIRELRQEITKQSEAAVAREQESEKALSQKIKKEINKTNQIGAEAEKVQRENINEIENEINSLDNKVRRLERQVQNLENSGGDLP